MVKFLHSLTLQKLRGEAGNATLSENFQECVEVDLFGMKATVIHNDVLAVASLNSHVHDVLFTRYVFLQLWGLFTRQVMTDFMEADQRISLQADPNRHMRLSQDALNVL